MFNGESSELLKCWHRWLGGKWRRGQQILSSRKIYSEKECIHSFLGTVKGSVNVLSPLVQLPKNVLLVAFFDPLFGFVQIGLMRDATNRLDIGWILLTSSDAGAQIHVKPAGLVFSHVFQLVLEIMSRSNRNVVPAGGA